MTVLLLLFAYFLGSIPVGVVLTKLSGRADPRTLGSRNIGATNVYRTAGKTLGVFTLLGDILKGVIPVVIARTALDSPFWTGAVACVAFLGHLYPVFLNFKGGKGVATGLGVFIALSPLPTLLAAAVFVFTVFKWRYISLGSIAAAGAFVVFLSLLDPHKIYIPFAMAVAALIVYRHRENIARLMAGTENKFGVKKESATG
jgi:acyl phosphate:glycerol-3-phosphate acyltransferase